MIKQFLKDKNTEAWVWMTVNSFIVLFLTFLADVNPLYSAPIIAMMNIITKYINQKFIK